MRRVVIEAVLNGWTVRCGCQTVVYVDPNKLTADLNDYLSDPDGKEAKVIASAVNKRLLHTQPAGQKMGPFSPWKLDDMGVML